MLGTPTNNHSSITVKKQSFIYYNQISHDFA